MRSLFLIAALGAGCSATPYGTETSRRAFSATPAVPIIDDRVDPFAGVGELSAREVVAAALARNPTIERARQSWRAALETVDQRGALPDTMLGVTAAPLSFFSSDVRLGVGAEISQALPWFGKRRLRAAVALAEADAAGHDLAAVRQRLALMAVSFHTDYALVERALAINAEHLELLGELGRTVEIYLETGKSWQEDALEVDVELARRQRERLALEARRAVARARINALLHRTGDAPLPPPVPLADPEPERAPLDALTAAALRQRPELHAVDDRARGADAAIELAERDDYPDLRVTGTFNRMWPVIEHQIMVGVAINLPTARDRREAAKAEARARRAGIDASRAERADEVRLEVSTSHARLAESIAAVALYRDRLVPAARDRVAAVRIGLDAGRTDFEDVIRAEAELRRAELELARARADARLHRAELVWATGAPLTGDRS